MPSKKQKAKPRPNAKATTKRRGPARRRNPVATPPGRGGSSSTERAPNSPDSAIVARDEKYVVLNLDRDPDLDYYVKTSGPGGSEGGDVWASRRAEPGAPKPSPIRITSVGFHVDWDKFNYFIDEDGDVSRKPRRWRRKVPQ
jgi:hypothetical protein